MPERIQLSRKKGWRMPANSIKVDRATDWGNPFTLGCNPSKFSTTLPTECNSTKTILACFDYYARLRHKYEEGWLKPLRGKNLACWCPPHSECHADILLELANK